METDASGWKTVYHTKQTQEQRGTITKRYDRITRAVAGETSEIGDDKTVSGSLDAHKNTPITTVHTQILSEDIKISSSPPYDRGFFERLISECENFDKGHGKERVIKVEMSDWKQEPGGDPKRKVFEESCKKSGEEENVKRFVYTLRNSPTKEERSDTKKDENSQKAAETEKIKKTRHVQWNDEKTTDKINTTTEAKCEQGEINYVNPVSKAKEFSHWERTTDEAPLQERKTYKDWTIFKEKLLKEFENVPNPIRVEINLDKSQGTPTAKSEMKQPTQVESKIYSGNLSPQTKSQDMPKPKLTENAFEPQKFQYIHQNPNLLPQKSQNVPKSETVHNPLKSLEISQNSDKSPSGKSPKTRLKFQKKVRAVTDDWELQKQISLDFGVEECKQREQQMAGNLREIREIVEDVRKLSRKFPKGVDNVVETKWQPVKLNESALSSSARNDNVVYVTEIKFPVNGSNGYKPQRTTAI